MIPFKFFPSPVSTTDPKYSAKYSQKMKKVTPIEKKTKRQPKGRFDKYA